MKKYTYRFGEAYVVQLPVHSSLINTLRCTCEGNVIADEGHHILGLAIIRPSYGEN